MRQQCPRQATGHRGGAGGDDAQLLVLTAHGECHDSAAVTAGDVQHRQVPGGRQRANREGAGGDDEVRDGH